MKKRAVAHDIPQPKCQQASRSWRFGRFALVAPLAQHQNNSGTCQPGPECLADAPLGGGRPFLRMSHDKPDCAEHCTLAAFCAERDRCAEPPAPLSLAEALERFEREAVRGVCDTGRYRTDYWTWGSGPPLLFVHGLAGTSHSFVRVAALLAPRFRCIAYDLPAAGCTHADLVSDLFALLDHLKLPRCYVYGASLGATVALAALAARPERMPRAILQSGFAHRRLRRLECWLARIGCWLPGTLRWFPPWPRMLRHMHQGPFAGLPPQVWGFFEQQATSSRIATVSRLGLLTHQLDLRPLLSGIRQPVLLIDGDADPLVDRACGEELLAGLPNARRVELVGCGHLPAYTHPEPTAALVCDFLTPPTPAPSPAAVIAT